MDLEISVETLDLEALVETLEAILEPLLHDLLVCELHRYVNEYSSSIDNLKEVKSSL